MNFIKTIAFAATMAIGATAAQAATYTATDLNIIVDSSEESTAFEVTDAGTISSLAITLGISTCGLDFSSDGSCNDGGRFTFNGELSLRLTTALGTVLDLVIEDTYEGEDGGTTAELTFEDGAPPVGGSAILSGTFAPIDMLSTVFGEMAAGTWFLTIGDDVSSDPKRLDSYSVTVNGTASPVPLPAGLPLMLLGLGGIGLVARKRRAG